MSCVVRHPYHLVDESPWPLFSALGAFFLTIGLLKWFHLNNCSLLFLGATTTVLVIFSWWRDISAEARFQGLHTIFVELGIRYGMLLFIVSEVLFFFSFFWAFFHSRVAPRTELGTQWPPSGICPFDPLEVPLLNTIVLLSSGISVTWAHHALITRNHALSLRGLAYTIILGAYFTCLQGLEYYEASFSIADGTFGSTFFLATGFHGFHVIVGSVFLVTCFSRLWRGAFRGAHHFGFEAAAWYWHFVDIVWLFLYVSIYWWGGYPG